MDYGLETIPQYLVGAAVLLIALREMGKLLEVVLKRRGANGKVYVEKSLEGVLESLSKHLDTNTQVLMQLVHELTELRREVSMK